MEGYDQRGVNGNLYITDNILFLNVGDRHIWGGVFVLLVFFKLHIYVIHTLLYVYKLSHNLKIKAFVSEVTLAIVRKLSYQSWPGP